MHEWTATIDQLIENLIRVWSATPPFAPLAQIIARDKEILLDRISSTTRETSPQILDNVRDYIVRHALENIAQPLDWRHFSLFRETETVQVILEDCFGMQLGAEQDVLLLPHRDEAMKIIVRCLFSRHLREIEIRDVITFLQIFSGNRSKEQPDQDRSMRYKTIVWFVYLTMEIVKTDRASCRKGLEYLREKFRLLLDRVLDGSVINEESRKPGFDGGKWETTLFGWLQGEDRRDFVSKLKRQFNMENTVEHANRLLLAEHRKCVFEQVLALFC